MTDIKTVTCILCGQTVTKRKTLSLEQLGGGDGRACRTHEEVAKLVEEVQVKNQLKKDLHRAEEGLQVIMLTSAIRVWNAIKGEPFELTLRRLEMNKTPFSILQRVKQELDRKGPMSVQELGHVVLTGIPLIQKLEKLHNP